MTSCDFLHAETEQLIRWQNGERPGPLEVVFFPTNRCNQHCKICWQRQAEKEQGGLDFSELSDARMVELVQEAAELGAQQCYIVGGGEPMVRGPLVIQMCERAKARGMKGTLHTNGSLFNRGQLERLVEMGWEELVVSLDGPDAAINDDIRSAPCFERATRNLRLLADIRREQNRSTPKVTINMVVTNTNFEHLDRMVQLIHDLECEGGLQAAMLLPLSPECAEFAMSAEQLAALPVHVDKAITLAQQLGVNQSLASLIAPDTCMKATRLTTRGDGPAMLNSQCYESWLCLTIMADGHVGPCCMSWDAQSPQVQNLSLKEIWYGPFYDDLRQRLQARRKLPPYCKDCPSQLVQRTALIWERLLPPPAPSSVPSIGRTWRFLREQGFGAAVRRAKEWIQVRTRRV